MPEVSLPLELPPRGREGTETGRAAGPFCPSTGVVQITNELISCYGNAMWENFGEEKKKIIGNFYLFGPGSYSNRRTCHRLPVGFHGVGC